jgi:hypothetical protein
VDRPVLDGEHGEALIEARARVAALLHDRDDQAVRLVDGLARLVHERGLDQLPVPGVPLTRHRRDRLDAELRVPPLALGELLQCGSALRLVFPDPVVLGTEPLAQLPAPKLLPCKKSDQSEHNDGDDDDAYDRTC